MCATVCECALARVPSSTKTCSVTAFCCITFRLISLSLSFSLLTSLLTIITLSLPSSFSHTWGGTQYGWNTNKLFSLKPLKTQLSSLASDTFRCCPRRMDVSLLSSLFIRGTWVPLLGHPHLVLNISILLCHSMGFQMRSFYTPLQTDRWVLVGEANLCGHCLFEMLKRRFVSLRLQVHHHV